MYVYVCVNDREASLATEDRLDRQTLLTITGLRTLPQIMSSETAAGSLLIHSLTIPYITNPHSLKLWFPTFSDILCHCWQMWWGNDLRLRSVWCYISVKKKQPSHSFEWGQCVERCRGLRQSNAGSSVTYMHVHIPGGLLCNMNTAFLLFTS